MRRVSTPRRAGPAGLIPALAGLVLAAGCTRNYYIYDQPPSYVVPGETVVIDELCELPERVFSDDPAPVLSSSVSGRPAAKADAGVVASSTPRAPRVVISRPSSGPIPGRGWIARRDRSISTETRGGADLSRYR